MLFQSLAPVGQQVLALMRRAWQVASLHIRQYRMNMTIQMRENIGARMLVVYFVGTTCNIYNDFVKALVVIEGFSIFLRREQVNFCISRRISINALQTVVLIPGRFTKIS